MVERDSGRNVFGASPTDVASPPRWGLGDAAVGWLIGLIGGTLSVTLVALHLDVDEVGDIGDRSLGWFAIAQAGLWIGLLIVPLVVSRVKGNGMISDFGLRARPIDGVIGPIAGLGTQLLAIPLIYLPLFVLFDLDMEEVGEPARELTDWADGGFGVLMLILIVGLAAPVVEEIFYRGLLQRAMQRRFGAWPGVVFTSVIFGVVHMQLLQLPALIFAGMVFGVLAQLTGRLAAPIAAHMVFNMIVVVSLVWLN